MLEAKSIYFGGDIISAEECSYDSYARLGLKCPFCHNAVFLRATSSRTIKEKTITVGAYFAHFPSSSIENYECEARSKSPIGKQEIEQIKAEARYQRLKIYNTRLWELIVPELGVTKQDLVTIRQNIGERSLEKYTKIIQTEITNSFSKLKAAIESIAISISNRDKNFKRVLSALSEEKYHDSIKEYMQYLGECDLRLHISICTEVLEFLSTTSGSWTLSRLVALAVNTEQMRSLRTAFHKPAAIETLSTFKIAQLVVVKISQPHWTEAISNINKGK